MQAKILAVLNHKESPCRLWRNNVGKYATVDGGYVAYGLGVGSADLVGLVIGTGQFIACEIKTPVGRLSLEQKAWLGYVRKVGGIAEVLRSVEEAEKLVARLRIAAA